MARSDGLAPLQPSEGPACYRGKALEQIRDWVSSRNLSLYARNYIAEALKGPDEARASRGRMKGRFPSSRMGVSLAIEHGWLGLAVLEQLEADDGVIAFFDKPPAFKRSTSRNGRKVSYFARPTLLALRADSAVLIDVVPEAKLLALSGRGDTTYVRDNDRWVCPSAAEGAAKFGFKHEVWTEARFKRVHVRNLQLLSDFRDEPEHTPEQLGRIDLLRQTVEALGMPTIEELLADRGADVDIVDVYRGIVKRAIFVDLETQDLSRWDTVRVFPDATTMMAYRRSLDVMAAVGDWTTGEPSLINKGTKLIWDSVVYEVLQLGASECVLRSGHGLLTVTHVELQDLVVTERAKVMQNTRSLKEAREQDALDFIATSAPADLERALLRLRRIEPFLAGIKTAPGSRTLRRYIHNFRHAEAACGNGFIGLVPRYKSCGNRTLRHTNAVLKLVNDEIAKHDGSRKLDRLKLHGSIAEACDKEGLQSPSYSWVCNYIKKLHRYRLIASLAGTKAAYPVKPRRQNDVVSDVDVEPGEAWDRAHVDHTEIQLECIDEDTGENLGRPWLTVMFDHATRHVLAFFLSFEPPSYRSVLAVMRDCVQRHGRLPRLLIVDGGKEFRSTWFETAAAALGVKVLHRPPNEPREGSQGERFFGSTQTMLMDYLTGNTHLTRNVRQLTQEVDPRRLAIWTLKASYRVIERFFFDVYANERHREIMTTPANAFALSNSRIGHRPWKAIPYNEAFLIATSGTTRKGTATVTPDGVKINYFYYNSAVLYAYLGKSLPVRFDPFNIAKAWAWVGGAWVSLTSRFNRVLAGMGEKQMMLITQQYRKMRGDAEYERLTDRRLVEFLREVSAQEENLKAAKQHAALRSLLNGAQFKADAAPRAQSSGLVNSGTGASPASKPDASDDFAVDMEDVALEDYPAY